MITIIKIIVHVRPILLQAFRQQAFSCNGWLTLVRATQKENKKSIFSSQLYHQTIFAHTVIEEKLLMLKKNGKQDFYSFLNATLFISLGNF